MGRNKRFRLTNDRDTSAVPRAKRTRSAATGTLSPANSKTASPSASTIPCLASAANRSASTPSPASTSSQLSTKTVQGPRSAPPIDSSSVSTVSRLGQHGPIHQPPVKIPPSPSPDKIKILVPPPAPASTNNPLRCQPLHHQIQLFRQQQKQFHATLQQQQTEQTQAAIQLALQHHRSQYEQQNPGARPQPLFLPVPTPPHVLNRHFPVLGLRHPGQYSSGGWPRVLTLPPGSSPNLIPSGLPGRYVPGGLMAPQTAGGKLLPPYSGVTAQLGGTRLDTSALQRVGYPGLTIPSGNGFSQSTRASLLPLSTVSSQTPGALAPSTGKLTSSYSCQRPVVAGVGYTSVIQSVGNAPRPLPLGGHTPRPLGRNAPFPLVGNTPRPLQQRGNTPRPLPFGGFNRQNLAPLITTIKEENCDGESVSVINYNNNDNNNNNIMIGDYNSKSRDSSNLQAMFTQPAPRIAGGCVVQVANRVQQGQNGNSQDILVCNQSSMGKSREMISSQSPATIVTPTPTSSTITDPVGRHFPVRLEIRRPHGHHRGSGRQQVDRRRQASATGNSYSIGCQTDWSLSPREPFIFIATSQCEGGLIQTLDPQGAGGQLGASKSRGNSNSVGGNSETETDDGEDNYDPSFDEAPDNRPEAAVGHRGGHDKEAERDLPGPPLDPDDGDFLDALSSLNAPVGEDGGVEGINWGRFTGSPFLHEDVTRCFLARSDGSEQGERSVSSLDFDRTAEEAQFQFNASDNSRAHHREELLDNISDFCNSAQFDEKPSTLADCFAIDKPSSYTGPDLSGLYKEGYPHGQNDPSSKLNPFSCSHTHRSDEESLMESIEDIAQFIESTNAGRPGGPATQQAPGGLDQPTKPAESYSHFSETTGLFCEPHREEAAGQILDGSIKMEELSSEPSCKSPFSWSPRNRRTWINTLEQDNARCLEVDLKELANINTYTSLPSLERPAATETASFGGTITAVDETATDFDGTVKAVGIVTATPWITTAAETFTAAPSTTTAAGIVTATPWITTAAGTFTAAPSTTTAAGIVTATPWTTTAAGTSTAASSTTTAAGIVTATPWITTAAETFTAALSTTKAAETFTAVQSTATPPGIVTAAPWTVVATSSPGIIAGGVDGTVPSDVGTETSATRTVSSVNVSAVGELGPVTPTTETGNFGVGPSTPAAKVSDIAALATAQTATGDAETSGASAGSTVDRLLPEAGVDYPRQSLELGHLSGESDVSNPSSCESVEDFHMKFIQSLKQSDDLCTMIDLSSARSNASDCSGRMECDEGDPLSPKAGTFTTGIEETCQ